MRFAISYYLLILYALVIIKPVVPMVGDRLEHEFNYIEHISTVHAMYGENHAEKEIASASKEDTKPSNTQKSEESVSFHLPIDEYKQEVAPLIINILFTRIQSPGLKEILLPVIAPPPRPVC